MNRDFLTETPLFIQQRQRILYESVSIVVRIMEINLENIINIADKHLNIDPDKFDFSYDERAILLSMSWGIVDQSDLLRQLIYSERESIKLESADDFMRQASKAKTLRDWMDHLPGRIASYVANKRKMPPAHGALSFTVLHPSDNHKVGDLVKIGDMEKYSTVVVLGTSMQRDMEVHGEPVPYEYLKIPLDHFVIQAFGEHLSLTKIVAAATGFRRDFEAGVKRFCLAKAEEIARETGIAIEEVLKSSELPAGTLIRWATRNK